MFIPGRWIRFAPDDGQGSGGDQGSDEIAAKLQALIDKRGGDASAVAAMLFQENYQLRRTNADLRAKVPAEGALVLSGDDAAAWAEYAKLGKPADLQQALADRDQAQGDLAKLRRSAAIREAAEAAGYKASVLAGLDQQAGGLAYEVREVDGQNGQKAKVAYVKPVEGDAVPLAQYAAAQWSDFLPALAAQPVQTGTPYPAQQSGSGKPPATDLVAQFQQEQEDARKAVKNPLFKE